VGGGGTGQQRPVDADQRHARLDQPPGQETALAEAGAAVALADAGRLAAEVERLAGGRRRDQVERLPPVRVAPAALQCLAQPLAAEQAVGREVGRRLERPATSKRGALASPPAPTGLSSGPGSAVLPAAR
jgi:hypothetical protein